jgi:hypothetical protein
MANGRQLTQDRASKTDKNQKTQTDLHAYLTHDCLAEGDMILDRDYSNPGRGLLNFRFLGSMVRYSGQRLSWLNT